MPMKGRKAHIARLKRLSGPSLERDVGRALFVGGNRVQVAAQIGITTGAVSGKSHVAGTPGGYPNADTHFLANNIETTQPKPLLVEVSSNAPYSGYVHDGTSRSAAFPFMALARDEERSGVEDLVIEAVKRAVKR